MAAQFNETPNLVPLYPSHETERAARQLQEQPHESLAEVVERPLSAKVRAEQFTVERIGAAKRHHRLPLCLQSRDALRQPLPDSLESADFLPGSSVTRRCQVRRGLLIPMHGPGILRSPFADSVIKGAEPPLSCIEIRDVAKGRNCFPLRRRTFVLRVMLLDRVFNVGAKFRPDLIAFQGWQSRHCLAEKAFRFRHQARH